MLSRRADARCQSSQMRTDQGWHRGAGDARGAGNARGAGHDRNADHTGDADDTVRAGAADLRPRSQVRRWQLHRDHTGAAALSGRPKAWSVRSLPAAAADLSEFTALGRPPVCNERAAELSAGKSVGWKRLRPCAATADDAAPENGARKADRTHDASEAVDSARDTAIRSHCDLHRHHHGSRPQVVSQSAKMIPEAYGSLSL